MKNRIHILAAAAGLALAHTSLSSQAMVEWTFTTSNCIANTGGTCTSGAGNNDQNWSMDRTYSEAGSGPDVTVSGWANTINSNTQMQQGTVTHFGSSGLGVRNADHPDAGGQGGDGGEGSPPEHGIDNDDRFDFVLFDFGTDAITLTDITLGYFDGDSDITVLAFTNRDGSGDIGQGPHNVDDLDQRTLTDTTEDLTSNGWELIGNYDVDGLDGSSTPITADISADTVGVSASYWLIGAYASAFSGGTCIPGWCNTHPADYVKLLALAGDIVPPPPPPPGVPEPATLLLLAGGLAMVRLRRT